MPQYAKVQGTKVVDYKVLDASFFNNFVDSSPGAWIEVTNARKEGNYYDQKIRCIYLSTSLSFLDFKLFN